MEPKPQIKQTNNISRMVLLYFRIKIQPIVFKRLCFADRPTLFDNLSWHPSFVLTDRLIFKAEEERGRTFCKTTYYRIKSAQLFVQELTFVQNQRTNKLQVRAILVLVPVLESDLPQTLIDGQWTRKVDERLNFSNQERRGGRHFARPLINT